MASDFVTTTIPNKEQKERLELVHRFRSQVQPEVKRAERLSPGASQDALCKSLSKAFNLENATREHFHQSENRNEDGYEERDMLDVALDKTFLQEGCSACLLYIVRRIPS